MKQRLTLSRSGYQLDNQGHILEAGDRKIKAIDPVTNINKQKIRVLLLSHNLITKVEHLEQFPSLEEIDLSYNCISNGRQLLKILGMRRLDRVKVYGNPFLDEPLDEDVLDFLVEKETDIEIFNSDDLDKMKDIQEGELKLVFLENYLKKMSCHGEITARRLGKSRQTSRLGVPEEDTYKHIIEKVMPQFYAIIDDPRFTKKIKKEVIGAKREEKLSYEEVIRSRRQKQQEKVENLIKDILVLVEDREEPQRQYKKYESIRESPIRQIQPAETRAQYEQIQEEKAQVSRQQAVQSLPTISQYLRKKFERIDNQKRFFNSSARLSASKPLTKNQMPLIKTDRQGNAFSKSPEQPLQSITPQKKRKVVKAQQEQESKSNYYSFSKSKHPGVDSQPSEPKINFETTRLKDTLKQGLTIQIDTINEDSHRIHFLSPPRTPTHLEASIDTQGQFNSLNSSSLPQTMYEQYYSYLTKYNPTFALLYSDISTLSSEEKSVLIDALAKDHKKKTVELFLEQEKVKKLKDHLTQNAAAYNKDIEGLLHQIETMNEAENLNKQYTEQLQKENMRLNELLKSLSDDMLHLRERLHEQKEGNKRRENKIKSLQSDLKFKINQLNHIQDCENIAHLIRDKADKRRKREIISLIQKRANQFQRVRVFVQRKQLKERKKLLKMSWASMKKHLIVHVLVKMKQQQKGSQLVKSCWASWKEMTQKYVDKKQRVLKNTILKNRLAFFINFTSSQSKYKKQRKLHIFWAKRQLMKVTFFKIKRQVKAEKQSNLLNLEKAKQHLEKALKQKSISMLKDNVLGLFKLFENTKETIINIRKQLFFTNLKGYLKTKRTLADKNEKNQLKSSIYQLCLDKSKKLGAILKFVKDNQQVKQKSQKVIKNKYSKSKLAFIKSFLSFKEKITTKDNQEILGKKIQFNFLKTRFRKYMKFTKRLGVIFNNYKYKQIQKQLTTIKKENDLTQKRRQQKLKEVLSALMRNNYERKMVQIQVHKNIERQQTQELIQKIKMINQMQIESIRNEHTTQVQKMQETDIKKQIQFRNLMISIENDKKQLADVIKLMKGEIEALKEKQFLAMKQKALMEQQIMVTEQNSRDIRIQNEKLNTEIANTVIKYERLLQIYTKSVIDLEKKQKSIDVSMQSRERKDKTVEKDKRPVGLSKNGQSLRNRAF